MISELTNTYRRPVCRLCLAVALAVSGSLSTSAAAQSPRLPPLEQPPLEQPPLEQPPLEQPPLEQPPTEPAASKPKPTGLQQPPADAPKPAAALGQLPWAMQQRQAHPPRSPREMLELFDIGESRLRALFDGQPLDESDEETIAKLLFRFPRMGLENIHRWRRPLSWTELRDNPAAHRAEVYEFSGVVRRMRRRPLIEELARLFEFQHYWVLSVEVEGLEDEVLVCTRVIPQAWQQAAAQNKTGQLRFGARFQGFFLKIGQREPRQQLIFAAPRAQWAPLQTDSSGVTPSLYLLGQLGMDVSRLEDLPSQNGRRPNSLDREAFYQMLKAADRVTDQQLDETRRPAAKLEHLLVRPQTLHGELMTVKAQAIRVTLIRVDDADINERFGISQYYQIDLAIPLGDRTFQLKTESGATPEYNNSFPGTICVLKLPAEMRDVALRMAAGKSPSELYDKQLVAEGFFFKNWGYQSQFLRNEAPKSLQPAPMFMAARLTLEPIPGIGNSRLALVLSIVFLIALAVTAAALWRSARGDDKFVEHLQDRNRPDKSLNDMNLPVQEEPDFSNLPD